MKTSETESDFFGKAKISAILLKITPPVMLAQLIQALYNIVDSFFVGKYSDDALTALSVIFPIQLIIIALAVGTGVGVNTYMAQKDALGKSEDADRAAGTGIVLAVSTWILLAVASVMLLPRYVAASASSETAVSYAVTYGSIVCIGSIFSFLEGIFTKVHQARGNMARPMVAQIVGAVVNIILDPVLIFGIGYIPSLGVAGAAYATVAGQLVAAVITAFGAVKKPPAPKRMAHYVKRIYFFGYSSIMMQALYTVYISILNMILADFSDSAVTVLGLYYKLQTFFFIPLFGLQTCIVPVLSYNYARKEYQRCRSTMSLSFLVSALFMLVGVVGFVFFPNALISLFADSASVHEIGRIAFPIIGSAFIPAVFSLIMPTFFQAIGMGVKSTLLSLTRQIFCLVPLFYLFSLAGLDYCWIAFPASEIISGSVGMLAYRATVKKWNC